MKTVLIFRKDLLAISETFVDAQARSLRRFLPRYIGLQKANPSLHLPQNSILLSKSGGRLADMRTRAYRLTGIAPAFHAAARAADPAALHVHFATDGVTALPLAKYLGVPFFVTLHGVDVTLKDEFRTSAGARQYLKYRGEVWDRVSTFICVSEFIRRKAIDVGFPPSKLLVHYIGVNLDEFRFRDDCPDEKMVLFVGRLVEKKGVSYLIQAMEKVRRSFPTARLVLIGDGSLRKELEAEASRRAVSCEFLGSQSISSVREWMWRASVFCAPSVTARNGDSEGLPIVILEALAMGVPVVGSRHAGIPEAILHEETGLLVQERDVAGLGEALLCLLREQKTAARLSQQARAWVERNFNLARQSALLEDIYDTAPLT
jgi:glycosyltransferase involved in cell wall biosynthesis